MLVSILILKDLTTMTAVLQSPYTETDLHTVVCHIKPAVRKVELKHLRLIKKAVSIHIMSRNVSRHMTKNHRAPLIAHLE